MLMRDRRSVGRRRGDEWRAGGNEVVAGPFYRVTTRLVVVVVTVVPILSRSFLCQYKCGSHHWLRDCCRRESRMNVIRIVLSYLYQRFDRTVIAEGIPVEIGTPPENVQVEVVVPMVSKYFRYNASTKSLGVTNAGFISVPQLARMFGLIPDTLTLNGVTPAFDQVTGKSYGSVIGGADRAHPIVVEGTRKGAFEVEEPFDIFKMFKSKVV